MTPEIQAANQWLACLQNQSKSWPNDHPSHDQSDQHMLRRGVPPSPVFRGLIGHDLGGHSAMTLIDFEDKPATNLPLEFRGSFFLPVWVCECFSSIKNALKNDLNFDGILHQLQHDQ